MDWASGLGFRVEAAWAGCQNLLSLGGGQVRFVCRLLVLVHREPKPRDFRTLMGTPNKEPKKCSKNIVGISRPGWNTPIMFLLPVLGFPVKSVY